MVHVRRRTRLLLSAALALSASPFEAWAQFGPPPGRPSPPYYESGVAWRGNNQGCHAWAGIGRGWGAKIDDLACKYCGDGRTPMRNQGPMWRDGGKCFNRYNGWKEQLPDDACQFARRDGGCAFLGDYDEDAPFQGIGYDPYPNSGAAIRSGGKCWNSHGGWKELLEDDACRYCGGNAWGSNAGPQYRKGQGCWNWNGRSWDGQLADVACKYHGCANSGRVSQLATPVFERASAQSLGDVKLQSFIERALEAQVPAVD